MGFLMSRIKLLRILVRRSDQLVLSIASWNEEKTDNGGMQDEIIDSMEAESAQNAGDVCESKIGTYSNLASSVE